MVGEPVGSHSTMSYSQGIARYCDLFGDPAGTPDEAAGFVERLAGAPCSVLDIGAGVGSTAFALAAQGLRVTALEPDEEMFSVLLARLALREDLEATLTPVPRAAGFALGQRFNLCLCLSVLHLVPDRGERLRLLGYAMEHLLPGGRLLLFVPVASPLRVERPIALTAERRFGDVVFRHYSAQTPLPDGAWCTLWKFSAARGDEELDSASQSFTWQAFAAAEVHDLLVNAGFAVERLHGGFDGCAFEEGSSRVLLAVARKPVSSTPD